MADPSGERRESFEFFITPEEARRFREDVLPQWRREALEAVQASLGEDWLE